MSRRKDRVPARPQKRPYSPKVRRKRFLLYCEGEATEPDYFTGFARYLRSSLIEVEIADQRRKDPKRLVELAKDRRTSANREAARARDDSLRYDEVWCIFDCDEHTRFNAAVNQAVANGLGLAASNPCFELWILIHFKDQYPFISCRKAYSSVKTYLPDYDKHIDFSKVQGKVSDAVKRAENMESIARRNGNHLDNPTTSVWQLVVKLCEESNVPISRI